jgi:NADPH2:quinone reductase
MRAWRVSELGEPERAMALVEADVPDPGPGQVLLRVRACALNFPDALMVRGQYQDRPPLPFTPGIEVCGDVVALGPDASGRQLGERVVGLTAMPHGGLADYAVGPAADLWPAPSELDDASAAALWVAYQTGWLALHRRAGLRPGETLLVHAAAGGVGTAAVQLGKAAGARVVGVVGGADKVAVARRAGADEVVDRTAHADQASFVAALREACGRGGADVVYDPVGGDAFTASTKVVAFEGRILVVGFASGVIPQAPTNHTLVKNYGILGVYWGLYRSRAREVVAEAAEAIASLVSRGAIVPEVSSRLPLADAASGVAALAAGRTTGRVVVEVSGP